MFDLYNSKKILIAATEFESELKFSWDKFIQRENFLIRKPEKEFFSTKDASNFVQSILTECINKDNNISVISNSKELIKEILKLESYKKYFVLVTKYGPVWFNHINDSNHFCIESVFV